jgi:hypothetical protein
MYNVQNGRRGSPQRPPLVTLSPSRAAIGCRCHHPGRLPGCERLFSLALSSGLASWSTRKAAKNAINPIFLSTPPLLTAVEPAQRALSLCRQSEFRVDSVSCCEL